METSLRISSMADFVVWFNCLKIFTLGGCPNVLYVLELNEEIFLGNIGDNPDFTKMKSPN